MDTGARRTRLTYFFFFRVVVISVLLTARVLEEWSAPAGVPAFGVTAGLVLVIVCYLSAIALSIALHRAQSSAAIDRIAIAQIVFDLSAATMLVQLTGGIESQVSFTYLLIVGGAGLTFPRGAPRAAIAAVLLFDGLLLGRHYGLLPLGAQVTSAPMREVVRALMANTVAILATGALAARLAVEIARTGASLADKSVQLEDLAALYADVVRSLSAGLLTLGSGGRVATANQAAITILGVTESDLLGRPLETVLPSIAPLLGAPRGIRREEIAFADRGVQRRLGVTLSPLVDSANQQIGQIVVFQDLTELRQMEEAVTRQKRLAAIGRLAAGVAHEIRNPLAAISGSIELLISSGIGDATPEAKELAHIVQRETERLNGLITELLEFARPRTPELQPLDLAEQVNELVQVWKNDRSLGDTRIEVENDGVVLVEADASQLRQVVWNLLRNAAEAAPDHLIRVNVVAEGAHAKLTIRDEGPGISDEQLSRVFEPFFSTKERGTGLGLPTVHRIIEEHRGTVELARGVAGGTIATVLLPLAR